MGEIEARECSFDPLVFGSIKREKTTSADTINAAKEMLASQVDLILFTGGDGTARDVYDAVGSKIPALGIPAGVKIHSAVYATNPEAAGELALRYLQGHCSLHEAEVVDVDEELFKKGVLSARLYGYLLVPYDRRLIQDVKAATVLMPDEQSDMNSIAEYVCENMKRDFLYVIGPGTTTRAITNRLGMTKTLLGVDVITKETIVAADVSEDQLLKLTEGKNVKIVVTPIGGQGHIFGRGNQQISPKVIKRVGRDNVIVVATRRKLATLGMRPLLVDTGDDDADSMLTGYMRVITGYRDETVLKVER